MSPDPVSAKHFSKRQLLHLILYMLLLWGSLSLVNWNYLGKQSLWGISGTGLFTISLLMAPLHHFYVWFVWRSELCYQNISPLFGQNGFRAYSIGFGVIGIARVLSVLLVGIVDYQSLHLNWAILWAIVAIIAVLVFYTFYSVRRYFGYERAVGADHFFQEYREMPFVRKGIFRFTSNAMYTFGMLILPLIGFVCESESALILGVYHYLAGWAHYYCTEKPDIQVIYGD
jgi:hypothetical protein